MVCSGLAVLPNPNEIGHHNNTEQRDMVFGLAQEASAPGNSDEEQIRRTITMVRCFMNCNNFFLPNFSRELC